MARIQEDGRRQWRNSFGINEREQQCVWESGAGWTSGYVGPPLIFFIVAGAFFYPSILKRLVVM